MQQTTHDKPGFTALSALRAMMVASASLDAVTPVGNPAFNKQ